MKKGKKHRGRFTKVILGIFSTLFVLILVLGLVLVGFYKSGEASLKASASSTAPTIPTTEVDEAAVEAAKAQLEYNNVVAWDDDWVVYDDKVYEYNEDTLNFLLMGIDRNGELSDEEDFSDEGPGQADAIFLLSLNQKDKEASIIGIPRNSMVEIRIFDENKQQVDTMTDALCLQYPYAGGGELGLEQMKKSVSDLLYGLPIHGACAISFDAIGQIVDMIGGVEVTIPDDMTEYNTSYKAGSTITLNKKNALGYLRYRNEEVDSPTVRLTRQKDFMKSAVNVAISKVKQNPMIVSDIYQTIIPYMSTDITLDKAVYLAKEAIGYTITNDSFYQLTGTDKPFYFTNENGQADFYDEVYLDEDAVKEIFMKVFYSQVVSNT